MTLITRVKLTLSVILHLLWKKILNYFQRTYGYAILIFSRESIAQHRVNGNTRNLYYHLQCLCHQ